MNLDIKIVPQPDDTTCGPSCLFAVYQFYRDRITLDEVVRQVDSLELGGTLAVYLALHALGRGYDATIYSCNLQLFDPSWFTPDAPPLSERIRRQMQVKEDPKLRVASMAYLRYLKGGGKLFLEDVTVPLIAGILGGGAPIIAGLSATWLYQCKRERITDLEYDDLGGEPTGHFVVVHGINTEKGTVQVADPNINEPFPATHFYEISMDRFIAAVLLGIVTYDAKLLVVKPGKTTGA